MRSSEPSTQIRLVNYLIYNPTCLVSFVLYKCGMALILELTLTLLQWYTLKDVKSGRVHLILEWVPAVSHSVRLDQVGGY